MSNSIAPGSSADVNVKVTALTTNPNVPVTYKTIILKKNLVNGVNTLTQEMMNQSNIKYVIKYDFDLVNKSINIPENCILDFDGGSLSNGTILGNHTAIKSPQSIIFKKIILNGSWTGYATGYWFGLINDCVINDDYSLSSGTNNLYPFINLFKFTNIDIPKGTYYVEFNETYTSLNVISGTTINGNNSTIKFKNYSLFNSSISVGEWGKNIIENVKISNINIVGYKEGNEQTEFVSGIAVGRARNVVLYNITSVNNRGDGFNISGRKDNEIDIKASYVKMINCRALHNYRQGLSIGYSEFIDIENCEFSYTSGTAPQN